MRQSRKRLLPSVYAVPDTDAYMLLKKLREEVLEANLELVRRGLVLYTFGNVSGIDRSQGLVAIKPSGVPYESLTPEQIVVSDLAGKIVDTNLRPSSDLPTHLELYRQFPNIGGVAHTHSEFATAWAQAETPIPCLGTTHADYFHGPVPVTKRLTRSQIEGDYELETGVAIVRTFSELDPDAIPAVLVAGHAPFCWGATAAEASHNAVILEYVARMACHTVAINADSRPLARELHDKHFLRKHGRNAYYGQVKTR
jgi:L-ribulose-5-phosphate 4-epimerase